MLDIRNLTVSFLDKQGGEAVRGVNLHMDEGEALGLVGESGSGKTMLALTVAGLVKRGITQCSGEILFGGRDLLRCSRTELRAIQGREIGFVFQEPMSSLNPLMRVGEQVEEPLRIHFREITPSRRREMALEAMERVDLRDPVSMYKKYPHQLSGGERQRIMIASAIITNPRLIIADEPTTALDVTVQMQITRLLRLIVRDQGAALLFISHDLSIVSRLCYRVAVMLAGEIVEAGPTEEIFMNPKEDYTKRLIEAIPKREKRR